VIVDVSLGGQLVPDLLQHKPDLIDGATVTGTPKHPPDEKAQWEMPHMLEDEEWLAITRMLI
jgi:hypothetical protein